MKKIYLLVLLSCLSVKNFATTYYSNPAGGDPSVLSSWSDNPAGGGTAPGSFLIPGDQYIVQSNMPMNASTWTVDGDVIMNSGSITNARTGGGGGGGRIITLNFYGSLTMNNNTFISGGTVGEVDVNLYGDFFMTGSSYFDNPPDYTYVTFSNTSTSLASPQHFSATGTSQNGSMWTYFKVNRGVTVQLTATTNTEPPSVSGGSTPFPFEVAGTLDFENFSVVGGGGILLDAGGTLVTTNTAGLNGSITTTGTSTLSAEGNYVFDGTTAQVTGSLLPATITSATSGGGGGGGTVYSGSLTINNPAGVTLSQSTTLATATVGGGFGGGTSYGTNLYLTSGNLTLGANNLTMGNLSNIVGTFSNTSMIITNGAGQLRKQFITGGGSFTYPIGDAAGNYTPISLTMSAASTYATGAYAGVTVHNTDDPHNAYTNNYLNRYWSIALSGITSPSYSITAQYVPGDVVGSESLISAAKYTGALPWVKYTAANTVTHTISATAVTNSTIDFTAITTAGPTFTITPGTTICAGTPTLLSVVTSTADGSPTYTWAPSTGLSSTVGTSVTASPTAATTYTATVTDGNGFTSIATTTLNTNPAPAPLISSSGTGTLCLGQTLSLSDAVNGGTWSSTNTAAAMVDGSGNVTTVAAGYATILYTVTGGCNVSYDISVVTSADPITGSSAVCQGATTALFESGAGTWSSSNTSAATVDAAGTVSGIAPGNTTITYTLAPGCTATSAFTVNALPATITGVSSVCTGSSVTLTETTPGGTWNSSTPAVATVSPSGAVRGITAGTTSVTYTLPTGCSASATVPVVAPPPSITGATGVCAGLSATLHDVAVGGTWTSGNTALATVDPVTGVVYGVFPGTPTISYFTVPGCATSIPLTVNPGGTPSVSIAVTPGTTVCPGSLASFTTTSSSFAGPTPTFTWVKNGITVATGPSYSYVPADGDVVYNVLHSSFACRSVDTASSAPVTLSVTAGVTPVVTISAVSMNPGKGDNDTLVANVTSATPTPQYQWYQHGSPIPGATMSYYVINTATTGTASYNCVVSSGEACNLIGISNALSIIVSDVSVKQLASAGNELKLAPNPNKGIFTINLAADNNEPVHVMVTNLLGETVKEFTTATNTDTEVNLNAAAGVYLLSANTANGRYVARVVVN